MVGTTFFTSNVAFLAGIQGGYVLEFFLRSKPGNSDRARVNIKGFIVGIITSAKAIRSYLQNNMCLPKNVN
jgi:hypothetical protein